MREFKFDSKESYTVEDVNALLKQHATFVEGGFKDMVSKEEYDSLKAELTPLKQEKRSKHISSLVGDLTSENKLGDAIALAGLTDEDDDDTIKSKVSEAISKRDWLKKDAGIPIEIKKNTQIKKEKKVADKKFSRL